MDTKEDVKTHTGRKVVAVSTKKEASKIAEDNAEAQETKFPTTPPPKGKGKPEPPGKTAHGAALAGKKKGK